MLETIRQFILDHQGLILAVTIISSVLFLLSLILIPFAVLRMPADHFIKQRKRQKLSAMPLHKRPVIVWHVIVLVFRNILGILFLIIGALLLVLPGPGWLTILLGIALLDFPFKHKLEMKVLSLPVVCKTVNAFRVKKNKPPIQFPEQE